MTARKKDEAKETEGTLEPKSIEALRASNELLSLFMRHSPVYAYIKSVTPTESRILQASDNYQRMLGGSGSDIVGKTMAELFPPEFASKITADDWAVVTNGSVLQVEKDMDDRSYISIKFPFVQGDKHMLAGYMFDITERKQAEESLVRSGQDFKEAQEAAQINAATERKQAEEKLREVEGKLREVEEKLRVDEHKRREDENKLRAGDEALREVEGKLQAGKGKLQEVENKLQAGEGKLQEVENKLQAGEGKLQEVENKLQAGEGKLQEVENKLQASEGKLQEVEDKLQADEEKLRRVEGKPQEVEGKLRNVEDKLQAGEEKLQRVEGKLQEVEGKLRAGEEKLRSVEGKPWEVEDKLRRGKGKLQEIEDKLRTGEKKLQEIENKLRAGKEKQLENENKLRAGEKKLQEIENKLRASDKTPRAGEEKLQADEEKLRKDRETLQAGEEKLRRDRETLRADEEKLRKDREMLQAGGATPASLEEKELLLREVNHQAKSNLDAVITLLEMQQKAKGKLLGHQMLTASALSTLENRIKPMALVHEQLYQSRNASYIDSQDYLSALVSHLRTSLNAPPEIACSVNAAGIELKPDIAVHIGMIVNELATNALKYAFPKNQPCFGADKCEITISLERRNAEYTLVVDDNGVGLPKDYSSRHTSGLLLVKMLAVDQLGGKLTLNRTHGTRFVLKFNVKQ